MDKNNTDIYVQLLKDRGLRVTPQRLQILKYLNIHKNHPDVTTIFTALRKENPALSKTTIYNTLEALAEHGLVQVLTITPTENRFDAGDRMHHHFLCKHCNKIYDIEIECPHLNRMLEGEFKVDEVHGYFKGSCPSCLKENAKNDHIQNKNIKGLKKDTSKC